MFVSTDTGEWDPGYLVLGTDNRSRESGDDPGDNQDSTPSDDVSLPSASISVRCTVLETCVDRPSPITQHTSQASPYGSYDSQNISKNSVRQLEGLRARARHQLPYLNGVLYGWCCNCSSFYVLPGAKVQDVANC